MAIMQEMLLSIMDLGVKKSSELNIMQLEEKVKDFNLKLSSNRDVTISSILNNGSLLLIFIRGTWCPFCRMHMKRLRDWVQALEGKNVTIVVVSSEPVDAIRSWLDKNPFPYLFASDASSKLSDYFGVRIDPNNFSQAATFLIDTNLSVRLAYKGKRTKHNFDVMSEAVNKIS